MPSKKKPKPKKKPTLKNGEKLRTKLKLYITYITKGMSKTDAALKAGYAPSTAHNAKENIENKIQGPLARAMARVGLDDDMMTERLMNGLFKKTDRVITKHAVVKKKNPKTGLMETIQNGTYTEVKEVDDMKSQMASLRLATQIRGDIVQKIEHSGGIDIDNPADKLSTADLKKMMEIYDKAKKQKGK